MHSKNLIHLTTWLLVNPHIDSRNTLKPQRTAHQYWVTFLLLSPFNHNKKNPQTLEASWYCLFLGNYSTTEKIPLAVWKLKPFSLPNGTSPLHIHTSPHPCNFCNKSSFHIRIAAAFVVSQFSSFTKNLQQSLHSSSLTDTSLKQVTFPNMFIHHTKFKKSFWTSKTPQKMRLLH